MDERICALESGSFPVSSTRAELPAVLEFLPALAPGIPLCTTEADRSGVVTLLLGAVFVNSFIEFRDF